MRKNLKPWVFIVCSVYHNLKPWVIYSIFLFFSVLMNFLQLYVAFFATLYFCVVKLLYNQFLTSHFSRARFSSCVRLYGFVVKLLLCDTSCNYGRQLLQIKPSANFPLLFNVHHFLAFKDYPFRTSFV